MTPSEGGRWRRKWCKELGGGSLLPVVENTECSKNLVQKSEDGKFSLLASYTAG